MSKRRAIQSQGDPSLIMPPVIFAKKGNLDKRVKSIGYANVGGSQQNAILLTATFPCTIVGLRWDLSFMQSAGSGYGSYGWLIGVNREGLTIDTIATGLIANFYNPEENIIVWGVGMGHLGVNAESNAPTVNTGSTKSMRKLQGGDELFFAIVGAATNTTTVHGAIQFFCKT